MDIKNIKLKDITPYKNNAKKHDKTQINNVAESIKQFGMVQPIVIDKNNEIVIGHCRYEALKKLGEKEAPCVMADDLTDEQIKKLRNLDNKLNESEWDFDLLKFDIQDLDFSDFDIDWGIPDLDDNEEKEIIEDEFDIEPPVEPKAKLGDIYQLGNHILMCGDSTKIEDVEKLMNGNKADMVFTDPPYNVCFNGRSGKFDVIKNDNLSDYDFEDFINSTINIIKYINPPIYYIWCNWNFYGVLQNKLDYKSCIVWAKNVFGLGNGYRHQHEFCLFNGEIDEEIKNESDLWQISKDTNYVHPTQKPITLCGRALKNHKNVKNVLDLFGGSGSTLIACEQLNRNCYMMELDPKYVQVIIQRYIAFKGTSDDVYRINADGTKTKYEDIT